MRRTALVVLPAIALVAPTVPAHAFDPWAAGDARHDVAATQGTPKWARAATDLTRVRVVDEGDRVRLGFKVRNLAVPKAIDGRGTYFRFQLRVLSGSVRQYAAVQVDGDGNAEGCIDDRGGSTCGLDAAYSLGRNTVSVWVPDEAFLGEEFTVVLGYAYLLDETGAIVVEDRRRFEPTDFTL